MARHDDFVVDSSLPAPGSLVVVTGGGVWEQDVRDGYWRTPGSEAALPTAQLSRVIAVLREGPYTVPLPPPTGRRRALTTSDVEAALAALCPNPRQVAVVEVLVDRDEPGDTGYVVRSYYPSGAVVRVRAVRPR